MEDDLRFLDSMRDAKDSAHKEIENDWMCGVCSLAGISASVTTCPNGCNPEFD